MVYSPCFESNTDLGTASVVRHRELIPRYAPGNPPCPCLEHEYTVERNFAWRAPSSGEWVIDSHGAEGAQLEGIVDGSCPDGAGVCTSLGERVEASWVVTLRKGQPIIIVAAFNFGSESKGGGVYQINISKREVVEEGAACLDWADNDGNGLVDCEDPNCASSVECTTIACADEILPSTVPLRITGELTLENHVNRYRDCFGASSRERVFAWQAPESKRYLFSGRGSHFYETVYVRRGGCVGPIASICALNDPYASGWPRVVGVDAVAGEWLYIVIDANWDNHTFGRYGDSTTYVLWISESVPEIGPACSDGDDNDGNGLIDEFDPSCGNGP